MKIKYTKKAKLPTPWGNFLIMGFEENNNKNNHVALIYGDIKTKNPLLTRIHSECLTGDALFSLRCDCGFQLKESLKYISNEKRGIIIYHRQEGRNIGLFNKINAYAIQDLGADTVEANHKLGFSADERDFTICSDILKILNIKKIKLITNNLKKIKALNKKGIKIVERIPIIVGRNKNNEKYLKTKENKMGHIFNKKI
ncbi:GTP cyclohydrolase II [Sodalis-like secondary symbiont of Drepanosiphum platanoidis]|uniref:GTP cyclohydrolase II n=1 Tax=Sodalis-like secondary symbiont of Drepanosiphum platanoidis TaxID=2994493 RepID=UPI003463F8B8